MSIRLYFLVSVRIPGPGSSPDDFQLSVLREDPSRSREDLDHTFPDVKEVIQDRRRSI